MTGQGLYDLALRARRRRGAIARLIEHGAERLLALLAAIGIDPVVTATVHGVRLAVLASHRLPRYVIDHPRYDAVLPALARFLGARLPPGVRLDVVDIGANIGDTAALIAAACGSDRVRLTCIEGDPAYLPLLRRNTADLDVTIVEALAGAETGERRVGFVRRGGTSAVATEGSGIPRRVLRLDELPGIAGADLIKLDVEGFEHAVLRGLARTLDSAEPLLFIEFHPLLLRGYGGVDPLALLDLLDSHGYRHAAVWDHTGIPMLLTTTAGTILADLAAYCLAKPDFYLDLLLAKDIAVLEAFFRAETDPAN